jgi:hypothetical protein
MNKIFFLVPSIFALTSITALANNQNPSYLFTQSAKQATVQPCANKSECDYKLTLNGINPKTTYFTDRPIRNSAQITTSDFAKNWSKGKNSFKVDNPNASLVYFSSNDEMTQSIIELSNPQLNQANNILTYNIKYLDQVNVKPGQFKNAVVFIDADACLFAPSDKKYCSSSYER